MQELKHTNGNNRLTTTISQRFFPHCMTIKGTISLTFVPKLNTSFKQTQQTQITKMTSTSHDYDHVCKAEPQNQDRPGFRKTRLPPPPRITAPSSSRRFLVAKSDDPSDVILQAASTGDLRVLKEQVTKFDDVTTVKDRNGRTALHYAAAHGKTAMCKYLIEQLNANPNVQDNQGFTSLDNATIPEQDHHQTFVYLLKHGAHLNVAIPSGMTTLHHVAAKGWKEEMHMLIAQGADVNAKSYHGTPLQHATSSGKKIAVKILLANGANPNIVVPQLYTPLMQSIMADSGDCVKLLLKARADPNMHALGDTPLGLATYFNRIQIIKRLLKAGANANDTNYCGLTAIEIAAMSDYHTEVMALLLDVTAPIPRIPDWSCPGIVKHVRSDEEINQRKLNYNERYLEAKAKGAEAVERSDFLVAIACYTTALRLEATDTEILADQSKCWACLNQGDYALSNALDCIKLRKNWPIGHLRAGVAYKLLGDDDLAADAFKKALELDPENKEIQDANQRTSRSTPKSQRQ